MHYGVLAFESAFFFGEFFINDGLLIILFFFPSGEAEFVDIWPFRMVCDFLKYVITDTLFYSIAPSLLWGSRRDGNVASSLPSPCTATSART